MNTEGTIAVRTYTTRQAAEMAVLELASCGIEASLATDDAGGAYPFLDLTSGVAVLVYKSKEEDAKNILEAMDNKENVYSPIDESAGNPKKLKYILFGMLIGAILTSIGWWNYLHSNDNGKREIYDKNGRVEETVYFINGQVARIVRDRNGDGKPDSWLAYGSSVCDELKEDNNFDGKPDVWAKYSENFNCIIKRDLDFDGIPDVKTIEKNGIVTLSEVKPKETNVVFSREIFQNGIFKETWIDEDMDGTFDIKKVYDPMGKELSVTRLTK